MTNTKKEKRIKIKTIIETIVILTLVYIFTIGLTVYFLPETENKIIQATVSVIPYPVVMSNSGFITVKKLSSQLQSVKRFYENQDFSQVNLRVDFSTKDGKKRLAIKEKNILNKLIDNSIIEAQAKKRGIMITQEILDQEVDRKLKEYGTGNYLKDNLKKLYGWDLDKFKENIVKPDLYQEKLFAQIKKTDPSYEEARKKIIQAKDELDQGLDFSQIAKKYSQGESRKNGGALGWFNINQMLPEVAQAIFNFQKNQQSKIIESSIGFHIVKVEDTKIENKEKMFKISQIFIPTKTFGEWMEEIKKEYKVFIPMRKFVWNSQTKQIEFREKSLNKYEQDLLENPINDPSIIF